MAGTIVVDRLESDASYASSINVASPLVVANTISIGSNLVINSSGINAASLGFGTLPSGRLPTIPVANMPTGSVLQVVQTTKTDTFSVSNSDFVDVTGLSVSITPTSLSNKILVMVHLHLDSTVGGYTNPWRIVRDSTAIAVGDAAGSRRRATGSATSYYTTGPLQGTHQSAVWLDSPSKTSSTTYKIQVATYTNASGTTYVNRGYSDDDSQNVCRFSSSIIVMEIAG